MKDPIILCPRCLLQAHHVRKQMGIRCTNHGCSNNEQLVATDLQVQMLKVQLKKIAAQDAADAAQAASMLDEGGATGLWHGVKAFIKECQTKDYPRDGGLI